MKHLLPVAAVILSAATVFTGYSQIGNTVVGLPILYMATTLLSLLTLAAYLFFIRKKDAWFLLLFSAVPVVNLGYCWLSLSQTLESALWANRLSYLGSVLLPLSMLMIILNVTHLHYRKTLPWLLLGISAFMFLIAASPGILDIYYQSVTLETVDGGTVLHKVYGPWHPLYLLFLLGYFSCMIAAIVHATVKKTVRSNAHAVIVAVAVFVNIGVWMLGQFSELNFEFLSVSYIISELFLLGLQLLIQDGDKLFGTPTHEPPASEEDGDEPDSLKEALVLFTNGLSTLTPTERTVYSYYIEGKSTKDVLELLHITENTLKYHNRNLYGKLGVSSRKQLKELASHLPTDAL